MEKEDNYTAAMPPSFNEFDYPTAAAHHHNHHLMINSNNNNMDDDNNNNMVDYMLNNPNHDHPHPLHHHQDFDAHDDNTVTASNNHAFTTALGNYHLPPGALGGGAMTPSNRFMAGSFADVMQFADFGPKLALNGPNDDDGEGDSNSNTAAAAVNYFLKFPVLNDHLHHQQQQHQGDDEFPFSTAAETLQQQQEQFMLVLSDDGGHDPHQQYGSYGTSDQLDQQPCLKAAGTVLSDDADGPRSDQEQPVVQLNFLTQSSNSNNHNNNISMAAVKGASAATTTSTGANNNNNKNGNNNNGSNKRKRPRTVKTTEEVESQRMIHIAVERNRRKQMNEHLRVLRSLMPSSYVQRGDQASIIGGAIEFVRELEQLLQCLESQKRRRLYGDSGTGTTPPVVPINPSPSCNQPATQSQLNFLDPNNQTNDDDEEDQSQQQQLAAAALAANNKAMLLNSNDHELDASGAVQPPPVMLLGLREETAENKSCVADVEVKLLGFDALIKILSKRRPGQLISAISALQDLEFCILHTNITTIEQTVLYSFNVKVQSEQRFSADDIATSVQQIFTFIHANSSTSL